MLRGLPKGSTLAKTSSGGNDPCYKELHVSIAALIAAEHDDLDVDTDSELFANVLKCRSQSDLNSDEFSDRIRSTGLYLSETMAAYSQLMKQGVVTLDGGVRKPAEGKDIEAWTFTKAQQLQQSKVINWSSQGMCYEDVMKIKEVKHAQIVSIAYMSGQWFGKILGGAAFSLNADWVYTNFFAPNDNHLEGKEWALKNNWFKENIIRASPLYVEIPPGSACSEEQVDASNVTNECGFPLQYIQHAASGGARDWLESSDKCALNSISSALFAFGDEQGANTLQSFSNIIQPSTRRLIMIKKVLADKASLYKCKFLGDGKTFTSILPLLLLNPEHMFLAQLVCADGGTEHCVTFYAGQIFDTCGLFSTSSSLTLQNLNQLCGWTCKLTRATSP